MINIEIDKLYTAPEVSKLLNVSHVTIFNKIKAGEIHAVKVGRNYVIKGLDLKEYLTPSDKLTEKKKEAIEKIVKKVLLEYGVALRKLGKE